MISFLLFASLTPQKGTDRSTIFLRSNIDLYGESGSMSYKVTETAKLEATQS
jgi:hypothetical protein